MGKMNKDDANKMAQAVDNRIVQIAKQVYRQVPNDREVEGLVTAFDSRYNSYTVKINNKEYSAIPQERTLGSIEIGTTVKVKIPNNQMSNAYICGIVDGSIKSNPYPLPLGMIIPSAIVQNDAGLHLLDGGELAIGGTYDAFCKFIISNSSRVATCTTAEYQTEMNTYGQCGKFVITSTYVKLPTITKFIEGLSDISNLGTSFSAGLPNIEGYFYLAKAGHFSNGGEVSGAFVSREPYGNGNSSGASSPGTKVSFSASGSNSIYGNSTTVQPQSTKFPYYIVVGTIINKDITVNINNITADLQNKVDKNAGNLSSANIASWNKTLHTEQVDLVYDMSSNDSSINWGYTSGITSNTNIYKDFTKYKQLRVYFQCYYNSSTNHGVTSNCLILDTQNYKGTGQYFYSGMVVPYYQNESMAYNMSILTTLSATKTYLHLGMFYQTAVQTSGYPNGYYCYKIEGVY